MSKRVNVLVLRTAGTNCNAETAFAFSHLGANVQEVHIKALLEKRSMLHDAHILALPGGFSYGDDIASGKILANEIRLNLKDDLSKFINGGKLVIGICNGFQILTKAGILPGISDQGQEATLFHNDSAKFEARWSHLKVHQNVCVWTQGMNKQIFLPVAHGEGKFIPSSKALLSALKKNGQVVFSYCAKDGSRPRYPDNPNGSTEDIAGICDPTGRVLGLMPHPERHFLFEQHPFWTRLSDDASRPIHTVGSMRLGDGAAIFLNGINYIKEKFQ